MSISIVDALVGKVYSFYAENEVAFSTLVGLVIDKERNTITIQVLDSGENVSVNIQPWIFAETVEKENSPIIIDELTEIRKKYDELLNTTLSENITENDAVDAIEEEAGINAALYYLKTGFPNHIFNTIPYILNRNDMNRIAYELILYAMSSCINDPAIYPYAYLPYMPSQDTIYAQENVEVVRRVARLYRSNLIHSYSLGNEIRFEGYITTFTGDHGWISVSDRYTIRFGRDSIVDERLLNLLKQGIPSTGWIEVSFGISRGQSGFYACRISPTKPALLLAKQQGYYFEETGVPGSFEDSSICGRKALPAPLLDILDYSDSQKLKYYCRTKTGEICYCTEFSEDTHRLVGMIICEGNLYNFHYFQVCDKRIIDLWNQNLLKGKKVVFEAAFNHTKNIVTLNADFIRFEDFNPNIPSANRIDENWGESVYDRHELDAFLEDESVNKDFVPLQPWLSTYDQLLGGSYIGKVSPNSSRQKGWVYLNNGFRFGFNYSQIQDELLSLIINSPLRDTVNWSNIEICFKTRKVNGINVADNVILTNKSRIELAKKLGLELPIVPLSERMIFVERKAFVPIAVEQISSQNDSRLMSDEVEAQIVSYNKIQKRIKLLLIPNQQNEEYTLGYITDKDLLYALTNDLWNMLTVSYYRRISEEGKLYPFGLTLTESGRNMLDSRRIVPIVQKEAKEEEEERTEQKEKEKPAHEKNAVGIILPSQKDSPTGFIGNQFYTKACGLERYPRGTTIFRKELLAFPLEYQYIYIVQYSYKETEGATLRQATSIELVQKVVYSETGSVQITNNNEIVIQSLYAVCSEKYLHREVSIILFSGDTIDGIVESYDPVSFSVRLNSDDNQTVTIRFDEIERIYIYGMIRPYNPINGTGRLDQYFFFHINNMEIPAEAISVKDGCAVKYCLRGVKKDNGLEGYNIRIIPIEQRETYIINQIDDTHYVTLDAGIYGSTFNPTPDIICIGGLAPLVDLNICDYKVIIQKRERDSIWSYKAGSIERQPKLFSGILVVFCNQQATVKTIDQYESNDDGVTYNCFQQVSYLLDNGSYSSVDTENNDYKILYTLAKQINGSFNLRVVKVCGSINRTEGFVVYYKDNIIILKAIDDYDRNVPGTQYRLGNIHNTSKAEEQLKHFNTEAFDYRVQYTTASLNGEGQDFRLIKTLGQYRKRRFGTLYKLLIDKNDRNKKYGFIVANEDSDISEQIRTQQHLDYYFKYEAISNPPKDIRTWRNRYEVSFCGGKTSWGGREASDIRILSIKPIVENAQRQEKLTVSSDIGQLVSSPYTTEETTIQPSLPTEINLNEEYGKVENSLFAILRIYSPNFLEIKLFSSYYRGSTIDDSTHKVPIAIASSSVHIKHSEEEKINTNKNIYLIRCIVSKANNNDDETRTTYKVDENYPIEILKAFRKSQVTNAVIINDVITIQYSNTATIQQPLEQNTISPIDSIAIAAPSFDYTEGESLYVVAANGTKYFTECISCQADGLINTKKGTIDPHTNKIFRFGIITDFDDAFSWCSLNNSGIKLNLSLMEKKAYNMLKAQKRRMLVMYLYDHGNIIMIDRCDESVWGILQWQEGVVQECIDQPEERTRHIVIQCNQKAVTHYLSTMSDGYVSTRVRNKLLLNEHVYIRVLAVPIHHENSYSMTYVAPDIHCISEMDELIEYDPAKEKYFAASNATRRIELTGNKDSLKEFEGLKEEILFDIQGNKLIAHIAAAGYSEDDDEIETIIETPAQNVFDTSLAQFLQIRLPVKEFYDIEEFGDAIQTIRHSVKLSKRSERNSCIAFVAQRKYGMEQRFSLDQNRSRPTTCSSLLMRSFTQRLGEIPFDSQNLDEYFFYANAYINAAIKSIHDENMLPSYLYRILQLDYLRIVDIKDFELRLERRDRRAFLNGISRNDLVDLLSMELKNTNCLIAHLVQFDEMTREYLSNQILPYCGKTMQELTNWLSTYGIRPATEEADSVMSSIHHQYLRTKNNVHNKITQALRTNRFADMGIVELLKYCCSTDEQRLNAFVGICNNIMQTGSAGYITKEKILIACYEKTNDLITDIEKQPTLEAVELLYNTNILHSLRLEIEKRLNGIYSSKDNEPIITCSCNGSSSIERKTSLLLVLENSATAHQTAEEIIITLESNTYGVRVTKNPVLQTSTISGSTLQPGGLAVFTADIVVEDFYSEEDPIEIVWTAQYKHLSSFVNGNVEHAISFSDGKISLQLSSVESAIEKTNAVNMYAKYHNGALTDSTMFFGRQEEKQEIMNFLLDDEGQFVKGRIVIVYGQKKCGKTSLMYQVMNDLNARKEGQSKAIILSFDTFMADMDGHISPKDFYLTLYSKLLIRLKNEIRQNHKKLNQELKEKQMAVPNTILCDREKIPLIFEEYMSLFMDEYGDEYQLIVSMDEFTGWCTRVESVYKEHPEVLDSMLFVKKLSDMGIVQIIIGHANMQRALSSLGAYNQIGQFARTINITAFKKETHDAEKVIQKPMVDCFGIDPYNSILGKRAIDYILDMTGRSPFVLMKLCDSIFKKYVSIKSNYLTDADIMEVVRNDIADDSIWSLHEFNFLLEEAGDDQISDELRASFKYLKTVALNYSDNSSGCDADILCDELSIEENEIVRGMLEDRKVIERTNNRIKINVELFRMYILHRYGKN